MGLLIFQYVGIGLAMMAVGIPLFMLSLAGILIGIDALQRPRPLIGLRPPEH
jgi:hypothetical protein